MPIRKKENICGKRTITEIRMPDKLAAVTQLAKMCGWNEPEKVAVGATHTLAKFLFELRSSG